MKVLYLNCFKSGSFFLRVFTDWKNRRNKEYASFSIIINGIILFGKQKKRGGPIMTQNLLPYNFKLEKKEKNLTGLAGLLIYLELFMALKLKQAIAKHLTARKNKPGYSDDQIIMALILLNLAGGESVSDIIQLAKDEGFCQILKSMELKGAIGRRREKTRKKWNKILKGKDIEWHGDGWYTRKIGGKAHKKIMLGRPKV